MQPQKKLKPIEYLICLHIQATCNDKQQLKPCQQAIQINAVLVNVSGPEAKAVGKFHRLVKPKCNPKLTPYCTHITGLTNQQIKTATDIQNTLKQMQKWINTFESLNPHNYTFVTWGSWTIKSCLLSELKVKKLAQPQFINSYTDLKRVYTYQIDNDRKATIHDAIKTLKIQQIENQQETKGQQIIEKLSQIVIFLFNNKKFKPDRKYITIIRDVPNVNVTEDLEYLLVLDFEATCQDNVKLKPCSQIIEFPVMVVDLKHRKIVNQFHEYVTPTYNPELTKFCTELTGITQDMVTGKLKLQAVLQKLDEWISEQHYLQSKNFTFVTCGDWDLCSCLKSEARAKNIEVPQYLKNYINIKRVYQSCLPNFEGSTGMMGMLKGLNIAHEGRHHSGIDDVRNICNVCIGLLNINGFTYRKNHISYVK